MATHAQALAILTEARTSIRDEILIAQARGRLGDVPAIARKIERLNICIDGPSSGPPPPPPPPVGPTIASRTGLGVLTVDGLTITTTQNGFAVDMALSTPADVFLRGENTQNEINADYWVSFAQNNTGLIYRDISLSSVTFVPSFIFAAANNAENTKGYISTGTNTYLLHAASSGTTLTTILEKM